MNPDDVVLVALLNNPRDLELIKREHWYRIPIVHAPTHFHGAQFLALYLSRSFGEWKWTIREYAEVRGHELVRRRDLLPAEPNHPRADELYYKLQLGALKPREPPIVSRRGRRLLFLWTDGRHFDAAHELNDLFAGGRTQDKLWDALKEGELEAERQVFVHEGRSRYRVDFLVYCPGGRLGIQIGPPVTATDRFNTLHLLQIEPDELEEHFEQAVARIQQQAYELGHPHLSKGAKG